MNRVLTVLGVTVAIAAVAGGFTTMNPGNPNKHLSVRNVTEAKSIQQVQDICDDYIATHSVALYRDCGVAQTQTNSEYLCASAAANAYCWVEAK